MMAGVSVRGTLLVGLALAAACGRVGFDTNVGDARRGPADAVGDGRPDAPPQVPGAVASGGASNDGSAAADLLVAITTQGSAALLVVTVADHNGAKVAEIVDSAGHALTSAGVRAVKSGTASELWYEVAPPPLTSVTVTMTPASNFDAWAIAFDGVHPGAPVASAGSCLEYPPDLVTAPVTTTVADELVVSVTMFAAPMDVSGAQPPFTSLPPLTGNDTATLVAAMPGSYATAWDISNGSGKAAMTCASSAAWLPGP
jgi:hypothetical protein